MLVPSTTKPINSTPCHVGVSQVRSRAQHRGLCVFVDEVMSLLMVLRLIGGNPLRRACVLPLHPP